MKWENILKNENVLNLKNEIDEFDKTQNKSSGPLIIILDETSTQGPYKSEFGSHRIYIVSNKQEYLALKQLYSQTNEITDKNNAFFVMS